MPKTSSARPAPVVPVLDLQAGRVVRAVRGERGHYRPMASTLAPGHDPVTLARALLAHPACQAAQPVLYVADLDGILGRGVQHGLLRALTQALAADWPGLSLWLDGGFADAAAATAAAQAIQPAEGVALRPVHGSESIQRIGDLGALGTQPDAILSLDCRQQRALDPAGCWARADLWPATLIVMTLDRVGADAGPDLHTFGAVRDRAPGRRLIGAGGVRQASDLREAAAAGAHAWLVASALHDGRLDDLG